MFNPTKNTPTLNNMNDEQPPPTPSRTYSLRPAWLTESLQVLEKFKTTSQQVKEEFKTLEHAFSDFEAAATEAKAVDRRHEHNLANGFTSTLPTLEQRKQILIAQSKRHPFVLLPSDIHGRIILYLELWDVDSLLSLSEVVCTSLCTYSEVWKPWATKRWCITQAEGSKDGWLMACSIRASVLRPILALIEEYRHRDAGSYKNAGYGQLEEWTELMCGLVYLTSNVDDWVSRRMIRRRGGVRLLIGLAEHDSRKIRTLALASVANALATQNINERDRWVRNLTGYRAQKIFSSIMLSPLMDVTSNSSREAARALINLSLPHLASVSHEHEVLYRSSSYWRGNNSSWEKQDGSWQLQLTYQSGGLCQFKIDNLVLRFEQGGILIGSMFDYSEDTINGRILFCRGWYDFEKDDDTKCGLGQISFSIYKTFEEAQNAVNSIARSSSNETESVSNDFLGGAGAIRNFAGYCTSQSCGFFGIWENSLHQRDSITLSGGGGFRLRWKRSSSPRE